MTLGQMKLIENYSSLKNRTNSNEIGLMIQFCSFFQTDDVQLFNEFKNKDLYNEYGLLKTSNLIDLYAKRYGLDAEKDIERIMYIFLENTINNGISYHLNSSANFSSIMELGLGISAIGLKTEERQDYDRLKAVAGPELFKKLQPYHGEKNGSKLFFSNVPILNARYGDRPEWLKELKLNSSVAKGEYEVQVLVNKILKKYDEKYNGAKKMLFLIPMPVKKISEEFIEDLLKEHSPQQIIESFFKKFLSQKDLYTNKHISSSEIVSVDLETFDFYFKNTNGIVEKIENDLNINNGMRK